MFVSDITEEEDEEVEEEGGGGDEAPSLICSPLIRLAVAVVGVLGVFVVQLAARRVVDKMGDTIDLLLI